MWIYILLFYTIINLTVLLEKPFPVLTARNFILNNICFSFLLFLFFSITCRFFTSAILTFSAVFATIIVNNYKVNLLKEPLVYEDFNLYMQLFRFPKFYLPFFGYFKFFALVVIITGFFLFSLIVEKPVFLFSISLFINMLFSCIVALLIFLVVVVIFKRIKIKKDIMQDIKKIDLFPALAAYAVHSYFEKRKLSLTSPNINLPKNKPNIIAVQSESFFDPKKLPLSFKENPIPNFDRIKKSSLLHGQLCVPVWGAYTMRTEFSFLTGIDSRDLGLGKYYPFNFYKHAKMYSLVHQLKNEGYKCICIHPFYKTFFKRNIMYPTLGFDEFIDISHFKKESNSLVSDKVLTEKIISILEKKTQKPLFIFAITIENHGPYHLKKLDKNNLNTIYSKKTNKLVNNYDFNIYLQHLKNADNMINDLTSYLSQCDNKNSALMWYGDHVPNIPGLFDTLNYSVPNTDYLVWHPLVNIPNNLSDFSESRLLIEMINLF